MIVSRFDELKRLRLEQERQYIDQDFVERLAVSLLTSLVTNANVEIYGPLDGEISLSLEDGPPNAGVAVSAAAPFKPRIVFRRSLIWDIYADALVFPLVCRQVAQDTDVLKHLHEDERFRACLARFDDAVPVLGESDVCEIFRPACKAFIHALEISRQDEKSPLPHEVRCRFVLFELMLTWTFFHELGHAIQRHYLMHDQSTVVGAEWVHFEMEEPPAEEVAADAVASSVPSTAPDLASQARELMADAEATSLTLNYLGLQGRINTSTNYLLTCAIGCLLQRMYLNYPESIEISPARHPHPVVRDESTQLLSGHWTTDLLMVGKQCSTREEAVMSLAYLNIRALLMTGIFRSHRIENLDGSRGLPSYMQLQRDGKQGLIAYFQALMPHLERQVPKAVENHLAKVNWLEYWFERVKYSFAVEGALSQKP